MPFLGPNDFSCDAKLKPQHCFYMFLPSSQYQFVKNPAWYMVLCHMSYGSPSRGPPHLRARSDPPKTLREAAESADELPLPSPSRPSEPRVATSPARGRAERSPKGVHDGSCRLVVGRFTVAQVLIFDQPGCFEPCQSLGKHQHVPASEPFLNLLFWSVTFQDCCQ